MFCSVGLMDCDGELLADEGRLLLLFDADANIFAYSTCQRLQLLLASRTVRTACTRSICSMRTFVWSDHLSQSSDPTFRADICRVTRRAKPASTGVAGEGSELAWAGDRVASAGGGVAAAASRSTASCGTALLPAAAGVATLPVSLSVAASRAWAPRASLRLRRGGVWLKHVSALAVGTTAIKLTAWNAAQPGKMDDCLECHSLGRAIQIMVMNGTHLCAERKASGSTVLLFLAPGIATVLGAYAKSVDSITAATGGAARVWRAERRTGVATCCCTSQVSACTTFHAVIILSGLGCMTAAALRCVG